MSDGTTENDGNHLGNRLSSLVNENGLRGVVTTLIDEAISANNNRPAPRRRRHKALMRSCGS